MLAIEKAYALQLAANKVEPDDAEEFLLIQRIKDALPPSPPRWITFAGTVLVLLVFVLTQLLLGGFNAIGFSSFYGLQAQLVDVSSPNARSVFAFLSVLFHANAAQMFALCAGVRYLLPITLADVWFSRRPDGAQRA